MSRRLEPQDLYAIQLVEDPQITPDGERIAYVRAEIDRNTYEYHRSIWVTSASGTPGRRFSAGDNDTTPRWSPDGQSLAFLRGAAGEVKPKNEDERGRGVGKPQLWVLPADGGEARQLTWARYGVGDPEWSPDGAFIVYSAEVGEPDDPEAEDATLHDKRVPAVRTIDRLWNRFDGKGWVYERRSHLFRIAVGGGEPEQLTDGDWDDGAPTFSPDGRQLAFTASPRRHDDGYTDVMVADAGRPGSVRRLTENFAPTFADTCIDDQRAFHGSPHLYWSPDGTEVFSQAAGRGSTLIYTVPGEGGSPRAVVEGQRRIYGFSVDR